MADIASARKPIPTIASRFAVNSRRSLSCERKSRRWCAEGAISSAVETAVQSIAATKTSFWNSVTRRQPFENGTVSRNANSTWTPGSATRSSFRSSISSG